MNDQLRAALTPNPGMLYTRVQNLRLQPSMSKFSVLITRENTPVVLLLVRDYIFPNTTRYAVCVGGSWITLLSVYM